MTRLREGERGCAIPSDVVGRVDAVDATAAGVPPAEGAEVEPGDVVVGDPRTQAAATRGARHWRAVAVANGERSLELRFGRVDHRRTFR